METSTITTTAEEVLVQQVLAEGAGEVAGYMSPETAAKIYYGAMAVGVVSPVVGVVFIVGTAIGFGSEAHRYTASPV